MKYLWWASKDFTALGSGWRYMATSQISDLDRGQEQLKG